MAMRNVISTLNHDLQDFLSIYGITLNDVKVLMRPKDERMRELISLRASGCPSTRPCASTWP